MLIPTKILVPTDFSEYSDRALGQALDIAKQYNAKVFLLHVVHESIHLLDFTLPEDTIRQMKDGAIPWAKEILQNQLGSFPQANEVEVATNVRQGIPYDEILKEGKEKGIDLIVIASLGRTGIAKYLIGSVARNVLKDSRCPVLLTK
ncbi:MAG: UspA protein [Deltaproteobacteria bacterium]|jgi:universal stress protein A|nr:UspA protein [Deltaproteobacteria bacterium]